MVKLYFIPNYGNEKEIRRIFEVNNLKIVGEAYHSGLCGCDSPYILNIEAEIKNVIKVVKQNKFPDTIFSIRI